jgi:hypothetical protein
LCSVQKECRDDNCRDAALRENSTINPTGEDRADNEHELPDE